jgi:hypothetical protein
MDDNVDGKLQWVNFFMNVGNKFFFVKAKKETRWKKFSLVYLEKIVI